MKKILAYLNRLTKPQRETFCRACETTEGYLRKAVSTNQKLGADLCIDLERESGRYLVCEELRPDVDWAFIRSTKVRVEVVRQEEVGREQLPIFDE